METGIGAYRRFLKALGLVYLLFTWLLLLFSRNAGDGDLIVSLWQLYCVLTNLVAALALLSGKRLGEVVFVCLVLSQIAVYIGWASYLLQQAGVLAFHLATLTGYFLFLTLLGRGLRQVKE